MKCNMDNRVNYYLPMGAMKTQSQHNFIKVSCHTNGRKPVECPYSVDSIAGDCIRLAN